MLADWGPTLAIGGVALGAGALMLAAAIAPKLKRNKIRHKNQPADSGLRPEDSEPRPRAADARPDRLRSLEDGGEPWLDGAEPWRQLDLWDQPARFLAALLTSGYRDILPWPEIMRLYRIWTRAALRPGESPERESYLGERFERLGCKRLRLSDVGPPGARKRVQMYRLPAVMTDGLPPAGAGALPAPGTGDEAQAPSSLKRRLTVTK